MKNDEEKKKNDEEQKTCDVEEMKNDEEQNMNDETDSEPSSDEESISSEQRKIDEEQNKNGGKSKCGEENHNEHVHKEADANVEKPSKIMTLTLAQKTTLTWKMMLKITTTIKK